MAELPEDLKVQLENFTPFQRTYAEYRAKGLKQSEAAHRAGSNASDKTARGRVGYQCEQLPGIKEYIFWLQQQRAKVAMIDQTEIIDKLRHVYDGAMLDCKYKDANTSVELLGKLIGLFVSNGGIKIDTKQDVAQAGLANNTEAFNDEGDDATQNETLIRMEKLQQMLRDVNKGKS
jgi:hypothetical protein